MNIYFLPIGWQHCSDVRSHVRFDRHALTRYVHLAQLLFVVFIKPIFPFFFNAIKIVLFF